MVRGGHLTIEVIFASLRARLFAWPFCEFVLFGTFGSFVLCRWRNRTEGGLGVLGHFWESWGGRKGGLLDVYGSFILGRRILGFLFLGVGEVSLIAFENTGRSHVLQLFTFEI